MKIRKVFKKDFKTIARIMKEEFSKPPYKDKWKKGMAIQKIKSYAKLGQIKLVIIDKKIVGFIATREEVYNGGKGLMIEDLVIKKEFQGKGLGKKLIKEIEKEAKRKKLVAIYLAANKKSSAFKFYKKLGYADSKYAVFMRKLL